MAMDPYSATFRNCETTRVSKYSRLLVVLGETMATASG
jgi:hypothetical protein